MKKRIIIALILLTTVAIITVLPAAAIHVIPAGDTVFRGEQGIDISAGIPTPGTLAWYAPGFIPGVDAPSRTVFVADPTNFYVDPSMETGSWYAMPVAVGAAAAILVADPAIDLQLRRGTTNVNDGTVIHGDLLNFRITSNLDAFATRGSPSAAPARIRITDPSGNVYTSLVGADGVLYDLSAAGGNTYINTNPFAVAGGTVVWDTAPYSRGTYNYRVDCNANAMNDNYDVTGKTVSRTYSVTIADDDLVITSNKDTVIRNTDFAITIDARPSTNYVLWVKGTSSLASGEVPAIRVGQQGVSLGDAAAGAYAWGAGQTVAGDTPSANQYAMVTTSSSGKRTVGFSTDRSTRDQSFTIRVQEYITLVAGPDYDEVRIRVEKGSVTITASGDQSYYIGEEVTFSGLNTDSETVYLFMTGPNLANNGAQLPDPMQSVTDGNAATFVSRTVHSDDTWEYKWDTSGAQLDAGTYTIYAAADPRDRNNLAGVTYATVSVVIRKAFVSATVSQAAVAKGDSIFIRGNAEGRPSPGVAIWVLGRNYYARDTQTVEDDATFEYELNGAATQNMASGQYFVVVQHPMDNNRFDVVETTVGGTTFATMLGVVPVVGQSSPYYFPVVGPSRLQGSDAAEGLIQLINNPNVDDTYIKLTFLVEEPWIRIDSIADKYVGSTFTITGTTNLGVGEELLVEVLSSSFRPTDKTQIGNFSGASGTVKVVKGDAGYNTWSFEIDATGFTPDEYIVTVESIEAAASTTTTFNIIDGVPVTPPPVTPPPVTPPPIPTSGFSVQPPSGIPSGDLAPGTRVNIDTTVSFPTTSGTTFPFSDSLQFYTELESVRWNIAIVLNGIENPRPLNTGRTVRISGFELEYPGSMDLQVRVNLEGTTPEVTTAEDKTILRIRQLDPNDWVRYGGEYALIRSVGEPLPDPTTHITLSPGWNFISTPKRLAEGNNTAAIFAGVDTNGRSLFQYNAASGSWETMTPASPVRPLDAIWIYANDTTSILLEFDSGAVQVPPARQLYEGWNAIGFSSPVPAMARDTLITISPKWGQVLGWNAGIQSYDTAIIRSGSGAFSDSREMIPMQGYWIAMTEEGVLYGLS